MRKFFLAAAFTGCSLALSAQTLFTYGDKKVTRQEFLNAFNKTPVTVSNRQKALDEYLQLYINFKLKVAAAYAEGLDKTDAYNLEASSFKHQLATAFLNREADLETLEKEALQRSELDISISQIFVSFPSENDTADAYRKIYTAYNDLQKGKAFSEVYRSVNPADKEGTGNLGFVTVFTLPYPIENIVYSLKNGGVSLPYKSKSGYHIFKRTGERPALGRVKVSQVLLYTPEHFTEAEKKTIAEKAGTVYSDIQKGGDFTSMVHNISDSYNPYNPNSETQWVTVGGYSPEFEQQIFNLKHNGDISKPFATAYGYHVVKRIDAEKPGSPAYNNFIREQLLADNRLEAARREKMRNWTRITRMKDLIADKKALWQFTDSFKTSKTLPVTFYFTSKTPLIIFPKDTVNVNDWLNFVQEMVLTANPLGQRSYEDMYDEFLLRITEQYVINHLQDYNEQYKGQLEEFNEANLLFAIMDKNVWHKAVTETDSLMHYYDLNKSSFVWKPGVSAVVVSATDESTAKKLSKEITASNWRTLAENYGSEVVADSNRYEMNHVPLNQKVKPELNWISDIEKNDGSNTYSFLLVTAVHPDQTLRSFDEAKGIVINEYQNKLEAEWINRLRKKYPVKVNQQVWKTIK